MISGVKKKHSQSTNKDATKEKPLMLLNLEEFQKVVLANSANIAHLGNVADLGTWSGLFMLFFVKFE